MRDRFKRLTLIGAAAIMILLIGFLVLLPGEDSEPEYQGTTLSEWVYRSHDRARGAKSSDECRAALKAMGTNAISALIKMAASSDGSIKKILIRIVNGQAVINVRLRTANQKHDIAEIGFALLGTNGLPALDGLIKLTRHEDPRVRDNALGCLTLLQADKAIVLPVLVESMKDSDEKVRSTAAGLICYGYPHDAERVGVYKLFPEWNHAGTNAPGAIAPAVK